MTFILFRMGCRGEAPGQRGTCALPDNGCMPSSDYTLVDVFTARPLHGNPLAVVMNTCGLATEQMQAIAREFNLSETTFVERRAGGRWSVPRACECAFSPPGKS